MGKEQGGGAYEPGNDTRLDFLFDHCTRSLKMKMDKWQKMYTTEEFRVILHEFFDNDEVMVRDSVG